MLLHVTKQKQLKIVLQESIQINRIGLSIKPWYHILKEHKKKTLNFN